MRDKEFALMSEYIEGTRIRAAKRIRRVAGGGKADMARALRKRTMSCVRRR